MLCFLSELLCLSFKLKLILKPAILLKFTHFQLRIENKQLRLLIVLELPHILTVIYVFKKRFYWKADTSFSLSFCGKCVAANFSICERFKIKRPPKWWMPQYVYNTIPHGKCFVRYLRTRCFCIRNLTRSLRSLVRFLIRQQLVRKYRTPALSMKYSLFVLCVVFSFSSGPIQTSLAEL